MSDADRFRIIQKQCQGILRIIKDAEKTTDINRAKHLYRKARTQMDGVTKSVKECLGNISVYKAA